MRVLKSSRQMYHDLYIIAKQLELQKQGIDLNKLSYEERIKIVFPEVEIDDNLKKIIKYIEEQ